MAAVERHLRTRRVTRKPVGRSSGGITVTNPLFDSYLDGGPPISDMRGGAKLSGPKSGVKGASSLRRKWAPAATFSAWLAEAGLSQMVALGLAVGLLVAVPLAMALLARRSPVPRAANPPSIPTATASPFRSPMPPKR